MKFLEPWWLLFLILPPVVLFYMRRSEASRAVRFTGTHLFDDLVIPRRSRIAPVLVLVCAQLLALTLAEPRLGATSSAQRATVVLVVDVSGSMSATDVSPTRLEVAKQSASAFVDSLPPMWKSSLVAFSERAFVVTPPTTDRPTIHAALDALVAQGGTATGDALSLAIDVGRAGSAERLADAVTQGDSLNDPRASVIVLLSDGAQTAGQTDAFVAAERAARLGIPIHTIALGTSAGSIDVAYPDGVVRPLDVPPDFETSARIAQSTGGEFFTAVTERELTAVYRSVSAALERDIHQFDLTPWLVALALGSAALAAALVRPRRRGEA
jgi:Ca-activated chloride channel family protein